MLARCQSPNITQYFASVLQPGSTELMIIMELMAASVFDVVCALACRTPQHLIQPCLMFSAHIMELVFAVVPVFARHRLAGCLHSYERAAAPLVSLIFHFVFPALHLGHS